MNIQKIGACLDLSKLDLLGNKVYYKRKNGTVYVRLITDINNDYISYINLYGPRKSDIVQKCHISTFLKWASGQTDRKSDDNYDFLDGAIITPNYVVERPNGEPFLLCQEKRAKFYLKKGYAILVGDYRIRFKDNSTEYKLLEVNKNLNNPFFLAVKNDKCCICGGNNNLTRHHVIPKRHIKKISIESRKKLSNVLFTCRKCHDNYEKSATKDPVIFENDIQYINGWANHFVNFNNPKFLPDGWKIMM